MQKINNELKNAEFFVKCYESGNYKDIVEYSARFIIKILNNHQVYHDHQYFEDCFQAASLKLSEVVLSWNPKIAGWSTYSHFPIVKAVQTQLLQTHQLSYGSYETMLINKKSFLYISKDELTQHKAEDYYYRIHKERDNDLPELIQKIKDNLTQKEYKEALILSKGLKRRTQEDLNILELIYKKKPTKAIINYRRNSLYKKIRGFFKKNIE